MNDPVTVFRARQQPLSLVHSMERAFASRPAVALLTAPGWFEVGLWRDSRFEFVDGDPRIAEVYEAQAFDPSAQLRWYREQGGLESRGVGALITEDSNRATTFAPDGSERERVEATGVIEQQYLLWAVHSAAGADWTWLHEPRIARVAVPRRHEGSVRLVLQTREYVVTDNDLDGNSYIGDERIVALASLDKQGAADGHG